MKFPTWKKYQKYIGRTITYHGATSEKVGTVEKLFATQSDDRVLLMTEEDYVYSDLVIKLHPTKTEVVFGYLSLAIPSAMLARIVRKVTGEKGTPLENFLMEHYFNMERKLLKEIE